MKATLSIGLCTVVVLLQLTQTPMAQVCSGPSCLRGAYLNSQTCECDSPTPATCAAGLTEVESPRGLCSCEGRTTPECKKGFTLNPKTCQCTIEVEPMCPYGTSLTDDYVRCTGSDKPICPRGAILYECQCVREFLRKCDSGELSWDGCDCRESTTPSCSNRCELDSTDCTCDRTEPGMEPPVRCYYSNNCGAQTSMGVVSSVAECCNLYIQPHVQSTASFIRSYRIGNGPTCNSCVH